MDSPKVKIIHYSKLINKHISLYFREVYRFNRTWCFFRFILHDREMNEKQQLKWMKYKRVAEVLNQSSHLLHINLKKNLDLLLCYVKYVIYKWEKEFFYSLDFFTCKLHNLYVHLGSLCILREKVKALKFNKGIKNYKRVI